MPPCVGSLRSAGTSLRSAGTSLRVLGDAQDPAGGAAHGPEVGIELEYNGMGNLKTATQCNLFQFIGRPVHEFLAKLAKIVGENNERARQNQLPIQLYCATDFDVMIEKNKLKDKLVLGTIDREIKVYRTTQIDVQNICDISISEDQTKIHYSGVIRRTLENKSSAGR